MDSQRVFQDSEFFQQANVQMILSEVLYTWSKTHTEGYQQGMLYLLGVVLFCIYNSSIFDPFADSYMIFDRIMQVGMINYFITNTSFYKKKCDKIMNVYLKSVDVELFIILTKLDVDIEILLMYVFYIGNG